MKQTMSIYEQVLAFDDGDEFSSHLGEEFYDAWFDSIDSKVFTCLSSSSRMESRTYLTDYDLTDRNFLITEFLYASPLPGTI